MTLHDRHLPSGSGPDAASAFPVVGIGASGGGLEPLETLTRRLATDSMAFVVLPHVAPRSGRLLTEVLARRAALPVVPVSDGTPVAPNHIYVTPPGAGLAFQRGVLRLAHLSPPSSAQPSIDSFFHTLASELGNRAVGVLLSGAGNDGTLGLRAIKEADGITFVQRPSTARQPAMPQSALDAGVVDFVLDAGGIADELGRLSRHPYLAARRQQGLDDDIRGALFQQLRHAYAVDFGDYRPTTIDRRIHRRMVLHKLDRVDEYLRHVEASPTELGILYSDLLFNVTGFFRDPEQFETLTSRVFPELVAGAAALRIWVAGCATGEEPYSIAICLREYLDARGLDREIQIFASDIDDRAIARARQGVYPSSIERQVSPQRLMRFFTPTNGGYQIKRIIRDAVVFARHNVADDPPFSRIDLLSCRNVLSALQPAVQRKVIQALHFALRPNAFLLLGARESPGAASELFSPIEIATRLYAKRQASQTSAELRDGPDRPRGYHELAMHNVDLEAANQALHEQHGQLEALRSSYVELYDFAPVAYCTLDHSGVILEINLTGAALLGADRSAIIGRPLAALVQLDDRAAFVAHLRAALAAPTSSVGEISFSTLRGPRITQLISAPVRRQLGPPTACRTVMIDVTQQRVAERDSGATHVSEQELRRRIERLECASAQVTASLATLPASNLRPLLQMIVDQARVLTGAELAGLGLGGDHGGTFDPWVVSGVAPEQAAAIGRAPRAIGVLGAVSRSVRPMRLRDVGEHALFSGLPLHHPVVTSFLAIPILYLGDHRGNLYLANKRDGEFTQDDQMTIEMFAERVGVTLEIARLRQVEVREHARLDLLARAGPLLAEPLEYTTTLAAVAQLVVPMVADLSAIDLVHDDGSITKVVACHRDRAKQWLLDRLCGTCDADRVPADLRAAIAAGEVRLSAAAPEFLRGALDDAEYGALVAEIGATCAIHAPLVVRGRVVGVLRLAMAESGRRYAAHDVELAREIAHHAAVAIERARLYRAAQIAVDARDDLLAFVTHDLHNYLATIRLSADALIGRDTTARGKTGKHLDLLARTVTHMSRLIEGLRDATMIETGQFTVATAPHDIVALVADAVETLAPQAESKSLKLTAQVDDALPAVACDRDRVLQVITNLVGNAIKFTPARGAIRLRATRAEDAVEISIHDSGTGIAESELPHVFDRYWKSGDTAGTGLGLFIARGIVQAHGGRIWAESTAGAGSAFHFTLPIATTMCPEGHGAAPLRS